MRHPASGTNNIVENGIGESGAMGLLDHLSKTVQKREKKENVDGEDDLTVKGLHRDFIKNLEYLNSNFDVEEKTLLEMPVSEHKKFSDLMKALPELDYGKALMLCGGEEEFLMELFELFTTLPIKEELSRFRAENDYKNYCIRITPRNVTLFVIGRGI